ncbi:MAG: methyltransferase domain-containing protein [candidate division NC10 bacterium]|nr:methyltransferase domain-containing protein [candidate division NC10 bacterium]MDE2321225.1 methyltransferase domain-containing protein [candidate division NC10 bacterium]
MKRADYDPEGSGQYYALTSANPVRKRWHLNKLRLFHLTDISPEDYVMDAGCGAGNLISELVPYCRVAVGCDINHARLAFAARRGRGTYIQADLTQLPFADHTFETIFFMEVIEHLEQRIIPQVLSQLYRILKPKGQLLITTPNYRSLWFVIELLADNLRLAPEMAGGEHISKYHRRTLAKTLTQARFTIRRMGTFNHLSPFVAIFSDRWAERLYRWELKKSRAGGNLLYALCEKS